MYSFKKLFGCRQVRECICIYVNDVYVYVYVMSTHVIHSCTHKQIYIYKYTYMWYVCIYICTQVSHIQSPETRITKGCEALCNDWEQSSCYWQKQQVFVTAKISPVTTHRINDTILFVVYIIIHKFIDNKLYCFMREVYKQP